MVNIKGWLKNRVKYDKSVWFVFKLDTHTKYILGNKYFELKFLIRRVLRFVFAPSFLQKQKNIGLFDYTAVVWWREWVDLARCENIYSNVTRCDWIFFLLWFCTVLMLISITTSWICCSGAGALITEHRDKWTLNNYRPISGLTKLGMKTKNSVRTCAILLSLIFYNK